MFSLYFLVIAVLFIGMLAAGPEPVNGQDSEVYLSIRAGGSRKLAVGIDGFAIEAVTTGIAPAYAAKVGVLLQTIADDMTTSGLFTVTGLTDSIAAEESDLLARWKAVGARYLLFGDIGNDGESVSVNLIDLNTAFTILDEEYLVPDDRPSYTGHVLVDDMIELFTGFRGGMASQIAFVSPYRGTTTNLFTIGADGRELRQLTYSGTLNLSPAWSANGRSIAYTSLVDNNWALMNLDVITGRLDQISTWQGQTITPSWSPVDPDVVAFSSNRDGNNELYTIRTNGRDLRRLTNNLGIDTAPSWSPDGSKVAFTSDRTGQPAIYVMNSDGSGLHRLTSRLNSYEDSPSWSPRGDRIAFVILFDQDFDIATASPDGGDVVILTSGQGSDENPKWSPDGLRIVFSSSRRGGKNLYIMNWDGSNVRPLTTDNTSYSPAWSPASTGNDIRVSSRR